MRKSAIKTVKIKPIQKIIFGVVAVFILIALLLQLDWVAKPFATGLNKIFKPVKPIKPEQVKEIAISLVAIGVGVFLVNTGAVLVTVFPPVGAVVIILGLVIAGIAAYTTGKTLGFFDKIRAK
jgi:hypothetical protein